MERSQQQGEKPYPGWLGKARDLGQSAKLNLDNVSEEENKKKIFVEIAKRFIAGKPHPRRLAMRPIIASWRR